MCASAEGKFWREPTTGHGEDSRLERRQQPQARAPPRPAACPCCSFSLGPQAAGRLSLHSPGSCLMQGSCSGPWHVICTLQGHRLWHLSPFPSLTPRAGSLSLGSSAWGLLEGPGEDSRHRAVCVLGAGGQGLQLLSLPDAPTRNSHFWSACVTEDQ